MISKLTTSKLVCDQQVCARHRGRTVRPLPLRSGPSRPGCRRSRRCQPTQRSLRCCCGGGPVSGTKVGTINIEQAIFASNEGRRDFDELAKKFEPTQNKLKGLADEIDSLKKQLNAQQDKLNDESRDKLVKQIEAKQKSFDRATQDAQEDFQNQQGEIGNKILTKMAPIIQKYVTDNGYGLLLDTSQPWPRGPVIVSGVGDGHHATDRRSLQRAVECAGAGCV